MFESGNTPWNKGKKTPEHVRLKISKSEKGKVLSEETKKKIAAYRGEKHHNWKGGKSRAYKTGYGLAEYKKWRTAVFVRDGFRCQVCGIIGTYLNAHHIKSFAYYPELRFEIDNGVTLCEECHKKTDNYAGRGKK
jgi:hypothetical protein